MPSCCHALRFPAGSGVPLLLLLPGSVWSLALEPASSVGSKTSRGGQYCRGGGSCTHVSSLGQKRASYDLISCGPDQSGLTLYVELGRLFQGWVITAELSLDRWSERSRSVRVRGRRDRAPWSGEVDFRRMVRLHLLLSPLASESLPTVVGCIYRRVVLVMGTLPAVGEAPFENCL